MTSSIEKFGQFVRQQRQKKGLTQLELSLKVFNKPNIEYIGKLERGSLNGITVTTVDKILLVFNSELDFTQFNY